MKMHKDLTISLIITTYNRKDALELVLLSVSKQKKMPHEVIIADDGSKDDTRVFIEDYRKNFPVPLLHCWQEDLGFRAGQIRNKAIAMARGNYIILIDGDVVLHPNFILEHAINAKPNQFIQGSRVLLSVETTKKALQNKTIHYSTFSKGIKNRLNTISLKHLSIPFSLLFSIKQNIKGARSCNMSCWKSDLIKVNGFSEEFVGWGREDSELVVRLLNNEIKRLNLKFGAVVYHLWHNENRKDDLLLKNDEILLNAIEEKRKICQVGLNQHLK